MAQTSKHQTLCSTVYKNLWYSAHLPFPINGLGERVFLAILCMSFLSLSYSSLSDQGSLPFAGPTALLSPNQLPTSPTFHSVVGFLISSCSVLVSQSSDQFLGCSKCFDIYLAVFEQWGKPRVPYFSGILTPLQWFSLLTAHWEHLRSFLDYRCLPLTIYSWLN